MENQLEDLYVRTQHDEREYISVLEIFFYDADGDEVLHHSAMGACEGLNTCGDMPDKLEMLKQKVEHNLRIGRIPYKSLQMEDDV
jgi:hypothetical protein